MKAMDQPSQRCTNTKEINTSACIAKYIENELGCNPRIHGSGSISFKSGICNSTAHFKLLANISKLLMNADANGIYNVTGCLASCHKNKYQITMVDPPISDGSQSPSSKNKYLRIQVSMEGGAFEEREHYLIYDTDSFIADIGGFLGLLLGWSVYSIFKASAGMISTFTIMKNKIMQIL